MEVSYCGKSIRLLETEAVERLKRLCNMKEITYIEDLNRNSITLLPVLEGKTIIIKTLAADEELLHLAQQLKQKLETSGANIIIDQEGKAKRGVLKLLDDQIVFCLDKNVRQEEKVLFYTSLFHANHCNSIVKKLINHLIKTAFSRVNINIASLLRVLVKIKYWPYLIFTPLPTILIEFSNIEVVKSLGQDLLTWLLDSFICCYGRKYTANDNLMIKQLLEELDNLNNQEQKKFEQEKEEHLKQIEEINERVNDLLETVRLQEEILTKKEELLETIKLQEEILAKNEELLKAFELKEEVLAEKEKALKPLSTLNAKGNRKSPINNQPKRNSSVQPKKNSTMLISKHLLNSNKYPLISPLNEPIYQFTRSNLSEEAIPVLAKTIPAAFQPNTCVSGLVSRSLFHKQNGQDIKKPYTESIKHAVEDVKENRFEDREKNLPCKEPETADFASTLQDFKRPALAIEEEIMTEPND